MPRLVVPILVLPSNLQSPGETCIREPLVVSAWIRAEPFCGCAIQSVVYADDNHACSDAHRPTRYVLAFEIAKCPSAAMHAAQSASSNFGQMADVPTKICMVLADRQK